MPVQKLTVRLLDALKPSKTRVDYFDESLPGFCVRVTKTGVKTFSIMYRHNGRLRRYTIGNYPPLTLADARRRGKDALRQVELGHDPAEEKKRERQAETFEELSKDFMERYSKKRKRSWREDQRIIDKYLVPRFKNVRAKDLSRSDVRVMLEAIAEKAPVQANRVLALLRKLYNWGISQDLVEHNPCQAVPRPGKETRRDRVLNADELREVWKAIEAEQPLVAGLFKIRILTLQRGAEVSSMRWEDLDSRGGWWTIPAERSKNGLPHRVPLDAAALRVLKNMKRERDDAKSESRRSSPWVFPNRRRPDAPIAELQKAVQRIRRASGVEFRAHDLRRTGASLMTGMGIPRLTVGKILNHAEPGVTAVYDRHSYDREKRDALDRWGRRVGALVSELKEVDQ